MVTLRDVARAAGVSLATASRALSDAPHVSAGNREHVLRTADELGYRPHHAARSLTTGSTATVGLVVPDLANPFFAAVAKGVQARARETGREVLVADTDEDATLEQDVVGRLGARVDGLVLCSPRMPSDALATHAASGRVALVNREAPGAPSISFDIADGVRQAVAHLRALGHRDVAYAGGPRSSWSDAERRTALAGVTGDGTGDVLDLGSFRPTHGGGVQAADLALAAGATAVLCFNDLVALGVLARLHARGARTPQDVSVVGFDDVATAALVTPALTTVAVPLARAGREAVDLLGAGAVPDAPPAHRRLPVELVVRASTAPAPAGSSPARTTDPEVVIR